MAIKRAMVATGTSRPSENLDSSAAETISASIAEDANKRSMMAPEGEVVRAVASLPVPVCPTVVSSA